MDHALAPRRLGSRPLAVVLVLVALLFALAATLLVGPGRRTTTTPLGPAQNGRILVADGAAVRSYAPDGTDGRTILDLPAGASNLAVSPDGRRLAVAVASSPTRIDVVDLEQGTSLTVPMPGAAWPGDQLAWSPTSDQLVLPGFEGDRELVLLAPVDGRPATILGEDVFGPTVAIWWPAFSPDADTIAVAVVDKNTRTSAIHLIAPDGSGHRVLETSDMGDEPQAVRWSPDPTVDRLLYTADTAPLSVRVLDVAAGVDRLVQPNAFWPTWSPTGDRLSYWGTFLVTTEDMLAGRQDRVTVIAPWPDGRECQDHPELRDQHWCGPAEFSPDGTRLIAPDITGTSILSVMADGSGQPIVIPLQTAPGGIPSGAVTWQPIRP